MATIDQTLNAERGADSRLTSTVLVPLTMVAGAAVAVTREIPPGSWIIGIKLETPTAFTGSPTAINLRIGTASTGQQVVADVDVKAQGHISATVVAAFDVAGNNAASLFLALAASGGTAPAGTCNALITYAAPVR